MQSLGIGTGHTCTCTPCCNTTFYTHWQVRDLDRQTQRLPGKACDWWTLCPNAHRCKRKRVNPRLVPRPHFRQVVETRLRMITVVLAFFTVMWFVLSMYTEYIQLCVSCVLLFLNTVPVCWTTIGCHSGCTATVQWNPSFKGHPWNEDTSLYWTLQVPKVSTSEGFHCIFHYICSVLISAETCSINIVSLLKQGCSNNGNNCTRMYTCMLDTDT